MRVPEWAQSGWHIFKRAAQDFGRDRVPHHAAALAYYALFAIGPLLLLATGLAGLLIGTRSAQDAAVAEIERVVGTPGAQALRSVMEAPESTSIAAVAIGAVTLLLGAAAVFRHLQDALDAIWHVRRRPARGIRNRLKVLWSRYLLGAVGVLSLGFLLTVALVLNAALTYGLGRLLPALDQASAGWRILQVSLSLAAVILLFVLMFRHIPDVHIRWGDVVAGAIISGSLFVAGQYAIGFYLGQAAPGSAFGAAGSVVIIMIWLYVSSIVFLFGAELTQAYANQHGHIIRPDEGAYKVQQPQGA